MFDFTDFLAFMAIEDAIEEEEKNPSPKSPSGGSNSEMTTGCMFSCGCIILAIVLGVLFESFAWFIGVSVIGTFIGIAYDVHKNAKGKKQDKVNKES